MFVDFEELKSRVTFAQVIALLRLDMKASGNQWRSACPACKKGGDRALVVTEGKGFFCFGAHQGGDQIALYAHIRKCSVKTAAQEIAKGVGTVPSTVPKEGEGEEKNLAPLSYLESEHDAVAAIGFSFEVAKQLGIGYAPKGLMRGTVAVPIRNEQGVLVGYIGIEDARLPPDFMTNVVPFGKKTA